VEDAKILQVALKVLDGIGPMRAKRLVSYCGGLEAAFTEPIRNIARIPGFGEVSARKLNRDAALKKAEAEVAKAEKLGLRLLFYLDSAYPKRLLQCEDAPVLIYTKGEMNLNPARSVAIIGTRNATEYGKDAVEKLVSGLVAHDVLVVSGLAYGIDIFAHKAAVQKKLQTVAVLGNSLDRIYPYAHKATAERMLENGGLISEFETGTKPDRENFPQRNRIVAGMVDAVIVVETAIKGGSMITANLAMSYSRDVLAFPGRTSDPYSSGCNMLIKSNRAALVESIDDVEYALGWSKDETQADPQQEMFEVLTEHEQSIFDHLKQKGRSSLDSLSFETGFSISKTSTLLLELEFKGVVKSMPGKHYSLV